MNKLLQRKITNYRQGLLVERGNLPCMPEFFLILS
jgi:hypothetical protein